VNEEPVFSNLDTVSHQPPSTNIHRLKSLVDSRYHFLHDDATGVDELYDLQSDALEERDLAGHDKNQRILERYRAIVDRYNQQLATPQR
jgi:hypothetical protein